MSETHTEKGKSAEQTVQEVPTGAVGRPHHNAESKDADIRNATSESSTSHVYLTGLRGILVVESFLWTFFEAFIPTLVSNDTSGPQYQAVVRKIFCVPLWNRDLIHNFFIILSMRTICISFLENPTGQTYAATVIRRIVRMVILLCIASGMASLIFTQIGSAYIDEFKMKLPNQTIKTPMKPYNALAVFNSIFDLFWLTSDFYTQAANNFWPNATLWVSSVIYYQSFTVYFLMVILPFTRPNWHIKGIGLFALGSFYMDSWGWYSATGLIFADIAINPAVNAEFKRGLRIWQDWRLPSWIIAAISAAIGIALKYTWVVLPEYQHSMLLLHPYLDLSEDHSRRSWIASGPYARLDDWFVICGVMMALESFHKAQRILTFKPLIWLGDRSFSIFTAQCIVFWTGGIQLWLALNARGISNAGANAVVFITCLVAVVAFSELFYRCVDLPSRFLAKNAYMWLVD